MRETLFEQVKNELSKSLAPVFKKDPALKSVFENICEPEFVYRWKATWEDDQGNMHVNTCWRVQQNSVLGPYKGGLRFSPSVNLDVLRFLALEQTFKNALTGQAIGGAKGGSDFDPKGKSDRELRRFCEAFMLGLHHVIGADYDVPAGDIGVNTKTIGYLYGFWKKLGKGHVGVITGKDLGWGGSNLRPESTGHGVIYLLLELLRDNGKQLKNMRVLISGAGNVASFAAKKAIEEGATVIAMSDHKGTYWCNDGMNIDAVDKILDYKNGNSDLPVNVEFLEGQKPFRARSSENIDICIPCATQDEIDGEDAETLIKRGCFLIIEGSNLSSTREAIERYKESSDKLIYVTSKLANLGGVGTSYLEMVQNSCKTTWSAKDVERKLREIMTDAYKISKDAAAEYSVSLTSGANIAAFTKIASVMKDLGYSY